MPKDFFLHYSCQAGDSETVKMGPWQVSSVCAPLIVDDKERVRPAGGLVSISFIPVYGNSVVKINSVSYGE